MKNIILFISILVLANVSLAQEENLNEPKGKLIFKQFKCMGCHSVTALGIESKSKKKPVDLSEATKKNEVELLKNFILKKEKINDASHPIAFKGESAELDELFNWLNSTASIVQPDTTSISTEQKQ